MTMTTAFRLFLGGPSHIATAAVHAPFPGRPSYIAATAVLALLLAAAISGFSCRSASNPEPGSALSLQLDAVPLLLKADSVSTSTIWATVLESGHPVADSTIVFFAASQGQIAPQALTRDGLATVTYTPGGETGVAEVVAQVKAVRDTVLVTLY